MDGAESAVAAQQQIGRGHDDDDNDDGDDGGDDGGSNWRHRPASVRSVFSLSRARGRAWQGGIIPGGLIT